MRNKKYLVYLDILGFEDLAREIASKSGFDENTVRQGNLSKPLRDRIEEIKKNSVQVSQGISAIEGSDNFVLIINDLQSVIEVVAKLTKIKIQHEEYGYIPLEIALGIREFDESTTIDPINETGVITFLKDDIINPYRGYYKKKYETKIKETFVVLTKEIYGEIKSQIPCQGISYNKNFFIADVNKIQQQCKIYEFLRKIKGGSLYDRIDDLYVPPVEFEDIKKILKRDKFVIITGTPEYGKTYTAIRLLWEYYNDGYESKWIKGQEEPERREVRERLEDIKRELKPKHITYFEDPFGKTKYEKRESLEREIGTIIVSVKNVESSYVIITSREEIFKEFEKEIISTPDNLKQFEIKLNVKKPSYNYEKRKEILLKWAEEENCKWLENKNLKNLVLSSIIDEANLSTPLSIKDFAIATRNITTDYELNKKIKERSKETAKIFANEIKNMSDDKILFLSFIFILSKIRVDIVKVVYEELVKELNIKNPWEFERVLTWFKDDKINVTDFLLFSHPSYSEALEHLLIENGYITRINKEIFIKVLIKLSDKEETARDVAFMVERNYKMIPEDARNKLLIKLSDKEKAAQAVANVIARNFKHLPEKVKNLLLELSDKEETARAVAWGVEKHFDMLPKDTRNKLLIKLSDKEKASPAVAYAIAENFEHLPEEVRNLLFKLSDKEETAGEVAGIVAGYYNELPENVQNLLLKLSDKEEIAGDVAGAITNNFNNLPEEVRNLLFKLCDIEETVGEVVNAMSEEWYDLPQDMKIKLLIKLSDKEKALGFIAWAMKDNFDKIPDDIKNELWAKFSETATQSLKKEVAEIFDELSEDIRDEVSSKYRYKTLYTEL